MLSADMHLSALEFDGAVFEGENRVVAAKADIKAGVIAGAALANDDGAGGYKLAAIGFDAAILRVAVAAVLGAALTFLMCHISPYCESFNQTKKNPAKFGGMGKISG